MNVLTNQATVSYNYNGAEFSTFAAVAFERRTNMPCQLYCNNGYTCGGCVHFVKSTSISITNSTLRITIPNQTLNNGQRICLCLSQAIPAGILPTMPVVLFVDNVTIPLRTKCGNAVYADQVRCRKVYPINIATDVPAATVVDSSKLCKTARPFSPITAPVVSESVVAEF